MSKEMSRGTAIWVATAILFLFWAASNLISRYSAADVRAVCAGHYGVQAVTDTTWSSGAGAATVVCKDGWVGQIHA